MQLRKVIKVPTGHIYTCEGEHGQLEFLSIGDYGKDVNLKCDAMGLTRKPEPVKHTKMLPLEEKWVIAISAQYGCSMRCTFCDVPKVGPGINATMKDMADQVFTAMKQHPEVQHSKRVNLHYARMGEPTWNPHVLQATRVLVTCFRTDSRMLGKFHLHPVVSTMMPRNNPWLPEFLRSWMQIKNTVLDGDAGLQFSINSTNEREREHMFGKQALTLTQIRNVMFGLPIPKGRKITLNFALAGWEIDADKLKILFNPEEYIIKLTPMHRTSRAISANLETPGDATTYAPYEQVEADLKTAGFDVLVFIASKEEDESRITCGNAILADGELNDDS